MYMYNYRATQLHHCSIFLVELGLNYSENLASRWKIKEFRCYERKIEESEKAGSRWESNPGYLLWLELPVLCHGATTAGQLRLKPGFDSW